ncbi:MAG: segregation/condensation protein A [Candidatus Pacearchaeota archaeon]
MKLENINGSEIMANSQNNTDKIGNKEVYNLLISRELSWQAIILDLIRTEQLDPWDIDLILLTQKYLERVHELEEASFHVSSKILLAAAILLRIKSEMLLSRYIKGLDEILFPSSENKAKQEFTFNLDDVSELLPKSPLPRMKKVTLDELMAALNRAMTTEHRRIKKEVALRHALTRFDSYLPKKRVNIREKIKEIYEKIKMFFLNNNEKMTYSQLAKTKEEKLNSFMPILHLDHQEKISLEQLRHFDEIYIYLKSHSIDEKEFIQKIVEQEKNIDKEKNEKYY